VCPCQFGLQFEAPSCWWFQQEYSRADSKEIKSKIHSLSHLKLQVTLTRSTIAMMKSRPSESHRVKSQINLQQMCWERLLLLPFSQHGGLSFVHWRIASDNGWLVDSTVVFSILSNCTPHLVCWPLGAWWEQYLPRQTIDLWSSGPNTIICDSLSKVSVCNHECWVNNLLFFQSKNNLLLYSTFYSIFQL
jgi:hypothetical protein